MADLSFWHWFALALGAWLTGLGKGGVPGAGIVTVAIFAWVLESIEGAKGVSLSVGLLLPVLVAADVVAVVIYRRYADWGHLFRLLPWTFLGIVGGYYFFKELSGDWLKVIIGIILLSMTALHFGKRHLLPRHAQSEKSPKIVFLWGVSLGLLAGGATMLANAAGPVAALFLIVMRLPKYAFLGTSAWLFLIVNVSKIPFMVDLEIISFQSMDVSWKLFFPAVLGACMGPWVARRLNQTMFEALVWVFIVVTGVKFLF
jgi:uncharacterized membrane protein YfcA